MSAPAHFTARIVARTALHYGDRVSAALDRPPFVRAASGIAWLGDELAIIQDDASFLALVQPRDLTVRAIPLPADASGLRQFDASRGNKRDKLDLECCFVTEQDGAATLFALGSGSTSTRERIVRVRSLSGGYDVRVTCAAALYAGLRARPDFSGSELNLEGAVLKGNRLVLFQRGNGAAQGALRPVNATCQIDLDVLVNYLDDTEHSVAPVPHYVKQYELGEVEGVRLTFTDATQGQDDEILFLASAEASPNTFDDGEVVGAVVGLVQRDGSLTLAPLRDETGSPCREKVEGIVLDRDDTSRAWIVNDPDDATRPACLLEVRLETT